MVNTCAKNYRGNNMPISHKHSIVLLASLLSAQVLAGSSSVIYPKIKSNGNSWYTPSPALVNDYENYFFDMDSRYRAQVVRDTQFSKSLLNVCGEVSALFYRYLHDQKEKTLFHATPLSNNVSNNGGLQSKEAVPFITKQSQYYNRNMLVEYPRPSTQGRHTGQFVYQYTLKGGDKSIFQLTKNTGGGNGKSKQMLFLAYLNYFAIDQNGNKQSMSTERNYVMLKIDKLSTIKGLASETQAFQQGQQSCTWLNKRID